MPRYVVKLRKLFRIEMSCDALHDNTLCLHTPRAPWQFGAVADALSVLDIDKHSRAAEAGVVTIRVHFCT